MTAFSRARRALPLLSVFFLAGCGLGFGIDLPSGRANDDAEQRGPEGEDIDLSPPGFSDDGQADSCAGRDESTALGGQGGMNGHLPHCAAP